MKIDKVCCKIARFIENSPNTQKVLRTCSDNPAIFSTVTAFAVATTARPAMTLAITPNKKDGLYSAASSISSAFVELISGFAMLTPMKNSIDKSSKQLYKSKDTIFFENPQILRMYKSINKRIGKIVTLPITSFLRFAMVYPISLLLNKVGINKDAQN